MAMRARNVRAARAARRLTRPWHAWSRLTRQARAHLARLGEWSVPVPRTTLYTRTVLWATAAICAALIVATLSETWVNYRLQQQVDQAQATNTQTRQDMARTARRIAWAESPTTIEEEARARGYVRPGEHAVAIAGSQPEQPATSVGGRKAAASRGGSLAGHWLDWWRLLFGG
jgi:cell division protein FtsB